MTIFEEKHFNTKKYINTLNLDKIGGYNDWGAVPVKSNILKTLIGRNDEYFNLLLDAVDEELIVAPYSIKDDLDKLIKVKNYIRVDLDNIIDRALKSNKRNAILKIYSTEHEKCLNCSNAILKCEYDKIPKCMITDLRNVNLDDCKKCKCFESCKNMNLNISYKCKKYMRLNIRIRDYVETVEFAKDNIYKFKIIDNYIFYNANLLLIKIDDFNNYFKEI